MRRSWSRDAGAPAAPAALAVALGVALGVTLPSPPVALGGALVVVALAAVLLASDLRLRAAGALLVLAALGFHGGRSRFLSPARRDAAVVAALPEDTIVTVTGQLTAPWSASGSLRRSRLAVSTARRGDRELAFSRELTLLVAGETDPSPIAELGDTVRVEGPLRLPDVDRNGTSPFGLSAEPWISLKNAQQVERLRGPGGFLGPVYKAHAWMKRRLRENLAGALDAEARALSLVLALLMGDTADLSNETVSAFRDGGVAHVLSISGLHVAIVALLLGWALGRLRLRVQTRDAILLVAVPLYACFAGARPPVLRAALMIGLYLAARLIGRPTSPAQVMGFSALVLLVARPENLFDVGFLLTYAAVFGLAAFGAPLASRFQALGLPRPVAAGVGATLGAELAVFPIQATVFSVVPFVSILSNLVVVPLASALLVVSVALLPLLLVSRGVAALAIVPLRLMADLVLGLLGSLDRLHAVRFIVTPPFWLAAFLGALVLVAGAFRRRLPLAAALVVALAIVAQPAARAEAGAVRLLAIDVGQGDSWALVTRTGRILVDGGGSPDPLYEFGRVRLLPRLARNGLISFDAVVLSHPHPDHSRGLLAVLDQAPVGLLALPAAAPRNVFLDELLAVAARRHVPVTRLSAGETLEAAGLVFDVLHPGADTYPRSKENNGSLVLRADLAGRTLLLTGDAEAPAERDLVARGTSLRADVLKVAHHGSRTSSTPAFLQAVAPRLALIGVGRRNRFGHPSPDVLARLANVRVLRTDRDGDFTVLFRDGRIWPLSP